MYGLPTLERYKEGKHSLVTFDTVCGQQQEPRAFENSYLL
jgi:hypothetical protein